MLICICAAAAAAAAVWSNKYFKSLAVIILTTTLPLRWLHTAENINLYNPYIYASLGDCRAHSPYGYMVIGADGNDDDDAN